MAAADSNSSSSTSVRRPLWAPNCEHGVPADMLTSKTQANPGRRFFRCQLRREDDCHFFEWLDGPAAHNYCRNHCVRILQVEKDNYERLLRSKAETINFLRERDTRHCADLARLNAKLEEAVAEIEEYKKWCAVVSTVVAVVIVYCVIFV